MFYTVFSTNDNPAMQWQSELLEHSWKSVGQEGALIRLVATNTPERLPPQKYAHSVATSLWDVHHTTGDSYPIYNKPASLLEWVFREKPEGTVLFLDPDCVFRSPVTRRVAPGFPASQAWVDLPTGNPSTDNPFGLGTGLSFLGDHCTRVGESINPVMIPTLIHTQDLRKICARWLELCGVVRDNYRNADGHKMWEADMFAYLAACAEYGLQHEPISLGICTNWDPKDVPDAPIIHYCQTICAKDGTTLFHKHQYEPWTRIDETIEMREDYDRDFIRILNDHIDELTGTIRPPAITSRPLWRAEVKEGRVHDQILLEIQREEKSLWLNHSGKAIWELCDGSRNLEEIVSQLGKQFEVDELTLIPEVRATVGQLRAIGFLDLR
ncbi:MAG: PqqD family protein [Alphaproteobacteria bacterium]|nr:PqqD family protein [Alphaproteobacteria bacterium]